MDGLLAAFRALANGKDALQPADLTASGGLKQADADFLLGRLTPAGEGHAEGGLDYVAFTKSVYGDDGSIGGMKKQVSSVL